jgi:16S rRNA (cytosine967-C5)-methyltransferase
VRRGGEQARASAPGITPARRAAYEVVRRTFEDDAWTDRAFASAATRYELTGRELAQARRLAYGAVQRRATSEAVAASLARRRVERLDPAVLAALRVGIYEICFSDAAPDHAAVDQAVELAKAGTRRDGAPPAAARASAGFVNAVLRRAAEEREGLLAGFGDETPERAAVAHSYPEWLAAMLWEEQGADGARALMRALNEPTETAFRVNTLLADPPAVAESLGEAGIEVSGPGDGSLLNPEDCLRVTEAGGPVPGRIEAGALVPQSRGSQAVVALLDPRPGERVLDLCAGPGIKTTQIAARMRDRGEIVSVELDPRRASEIEALVARCGTSSVRVEVADAAEADLGAGYDRVLVDPPCSDLGTLGSRPDARWRKSPEQIERLALLQRRILARAARALAPGGTLVYSTCTISARENQAVADSLPGLAGGVEADSLGGSHPALRSARDPRFLQIRPDRDRTTGFFIARFRRRG